MPRDMQKVLVAGVALGVTAALVVWFLERFELNRLHGEVQDYLANYDRFREWMDAGGGHTQTDG